MSRPLLWLAAVVVAGLSVLGWRMSRGPQPAWPTMLTWAFTNGTLAPGTILMAFAAMLLGYRVSRLVVRAAFPTASPVARIGRRSLDCYLILSTVVIVLPSVYVYPPPGVVAVAVASTVLVLMFLWCLLRDRAGLTDRAVIPAEHEAA